MLNYLSLISLSFGVCSGLVRKNERKERKPSKPPGSLLYIILSIKIVAWKVGDLSPEQLKDSPSFSRLEGVFWISEMRNILVKNQMEDVQTKPQA